MEPWTSREIAGLSIKSRIALRLLWQGENKRNHLATLFSLPASPFYQKSAGPYMEFQLGRDVHASAQKRTIRSVSYFQRKHNILSSMDVCRPNVSLAHKASEHILYMKPSVECALNSQKKKAYTSYQRCLTSPVTYMPEVHLLLD
jgi:hypothetical protein